MNDDKEKPKPPHNYGYPVFEAWQPGMEHPIARLKRRLKESEEVRKAVREVSPKEEEERA